MTEAEQTNLAYCLGCAEDVPTYTVEVGDHLEIRCAYCGFTVKLAEPAPDAILDCVVIADDDVFFRKVLMDILIQEKLAKEAIARDDGPALLAECVRRFRDERPITVVILDIVMAPMDGSAVALAFRALEKGFDLPAPAPILFLSAVRADDALRRMTERCRPAVYLNKGKDIALPQLAQRVKDMVPQLLKAAQPA